MKLDRKGRLVWSHPSEALGDVVAVAVHPLEDGGLAVAGHTSNSGAGDRVILFFALPKADSRS
jgi:hypothetical protein